MEAFNYFKTFELLPASDQRLVDVARSCLESAYAPYSDFQVACAIALTNGEIVNGTNQENVAFPATLCAERTALSAVSSRYPGSEIKALTVVARRRGQNDLTPVSPCGECRQVILEFENRQRKPISILMYTQGAWVRTSSAAALLPFSFTRF